MLKHRKHIIRSIVAAGVALVTSMGSSAFALSNGSFEGGGFGAWETVGQAGLFGEFKGSFNPSDPIEQAIAFTNRFDPQGKNAAASAGDVNAFFGLDIASMIGADIYDGSGIRQTFNLAAPSLLRFDWALGNRISEPTGNDVAFAVLDGVFYLLTDLSSAVFTSTGVNDYRFTDWANFVGLPELAAGEHTIGFGVVNVGNATGRTALLIDNVQLEVSALINDEQNPQNPQNPGGNTPATPEPVTAVMTMLSLGALGVATRRRRPNR